MNYATFVTRVQTLAVDTSADLLSILPAAIDYAELRIYRDLNLRGTVLRDATSYACAIGQRVVLPTAGAFITITGVNVITPAGTAADAGQRVPLTPVSADYLDMMWPAAAAATTPGFFALEGQATGDLSVILGPWPDAAYKLELVGTKRPAALSASNTDTPVSRYLPDLLVTAAMVFLSAYQKNYGSQADDPKMAMSWEQQYQAQLAGAQAEEMRKKLGGA